MIKNYLKIAFRTFVQSPVYTIISISGFAIGLLSCIFIIRYVTYENSYDQQLGKDVYRVVASDIDGELATMPIPSGPTLVNELSQVSQYTRFMKLEGVARTNDLSQAVILEDVVMGDGSFFELFEAELIAGEASLLNEPGYIYLSEGMAAKMLGEEIKTGTTIYVSVGDFGKMNLSVAGIMRDWPGNSHLSIDGIVSLSTINSYNKDSFWATLDNWGWNSFYTYVKAASIPDTDELNRVIDKYVGRELRENARLELMFQPIAEIHISSDRLAEYKQNNSGRVLNFLLAMAFFILLIAGVNYVNLTAARGMKRSREVGIRKNLGASRRQLISQFNLEALLMVMLSLILAITLYQLFRPFMINLSSNAFETTWEVTDFAVLSIFLLPVLLWAIWQPSWMVSAYSMVDLIKGKIGKKPSGRSFINISVMIQMSISILLIFSIITIYFQINYLQNIRLGMNIEQLLVVERPKEGIENYGSLSESFSNELRQLASVKNVSITGSVPGRGFNWRTNVARIARSKAKEWNTTEYSVTYIDTAYLDTYGIKLLSGNRILTDSDSVIDVLLNESAARALGITEPGDAPGILLQNGSTMLEVRGVIGDYMHNSAKELVPPTIFLINQNPQYFTIRFQTGKDALTTVDGLLADVEQLYKTHFPDRLFQYFFMDDLFRTRFESERSLATLVLIFSILAVTLSCMGLIGLSLYSLESRRKEMGIRKVMGATVQSILLMLVKNMTGLVLISSVIAIPLCVWLAVNWLEDYPNRITLSWWLFLLPILILMLLTLAAVSTQFMKLSRTNPVKSLRYE